jgi:hypothetical protein
MIALGIGLLFSVTMFTLLQKLTALLRFLGPLTGGASAMHAF